MKPINLLAVLMLALVTPAAAQVAQVDRVRVQPRPELNKVNVPEQPTPNVDLVATDPAKAREAINKLRQEKRELKDRLTAALERLDQMTKRGGTLVRAYCESESLSRNTAGASENCGAYRCGEVDGLCRKSCNVTTDCAGYHVCDTAAHVCVRT